ncbi:MAG: glycosyltransferase family 39 protein [Bacteroidales bacterium]|nr:glycosyltransferase family 39 protein [Bacteroidales bacterium]
MPNTKKSKSNIKNQSKNILTNTTPIVSNPIQKQWAYSIIFALTFLLYGNTIWNEYALDDAIVITQNDFTLKGIAGIPEIFKNELFTGFFKVKKDLVAGGRYRPLSMVTFAIEVELFGQNPHISHFINVLLFAIVGILLYIILTKMLLPIFPTNSWKQHIPFLATLLYIAHPIHTEVVANIKGRDEIMSLLGSLLAFYYILRFLETNKLVYYIYTFVSYLLAMFSKEIAATFIVTIPLALWFFTNKKLKQILQTTVPLIVAAIIYFIVRQQVVGAEGIKTSPELMNDSFLEMSISQKYATITYTMYLYIKLLFFPHPLTYDYYPYHIPIIEWSQIQAWGSLIVILLLAWLAFKYLPKKHIISFSILFYAISLAPVSNILFPVGVFMNERFVFVASIGFSLICAYYFRKAIELWKNQQNILIALLFIVMILYGFKTVDRNFDWKNDFTLFTTDVKVSVNGAKSNCSAGGKLIEEATKKGNEHLRNDYLKLAIKYLNHALKIHPTYGDALLLLGNAYYEYNKNYDSTIWAYKTLLSLNPEHNLVYSNTELIFSALDSVDYKIKVWEDYFRINPNRFETNYQLGNLYGRYKNDLMRSKYFLLRAYQIKPSDISVNKDLGVVYGFLAQYDSSLIFLKKAAELDKKDAQTLVNIGVTYLNLKQESEAIKYFEQAKRIDPKVVIPVNLNK